MELQFKKSEVSCLDRVIREVSSQEVTQEVRLTEGMPDIGRVLSAWGQMVLRSKEWRGDTVTLTGGIMVWILYAPEDGTEPRCIDSWIPYQLRWERLDSDREGIVRISPLLRFVDARTIAARKFMVRAGAAAMAEALCGVKLELYSAESLPEDIEVLRRTYPVQLPKEAGEKTFQIDEELTVSGAAPEQLISYTVRPETFDRRVLGNKVIFRGNGNLHLVYRCAEGRLHAQDFEIPFSQYAELDAIYSPDAHADVWMGTTSLELNLEEEKLRLKCGLVAQYLIDDRELIELIEDAYSPRRSVGVQSRATQLPAILENWEAEIRAEQVIAGHSGETVDVGFSADFPRQRRVGEQVEMEIPGSFQLLYYGEDGNLQSAGIRWEERMTIPAGEDSLIDTQILAMKQPQASENADGFRLSGDMQMQLQTTGGSPVTMATGLEVGEMREPDPGRPSLILCRMGGEDLWDLAKRCGSTVSAIESANAEIAANRMLLIPVS